MDPTAWIIIAVAAVALIGLAAYLWSRKRRSEHLRHRFGPEYDHEVEARGDRTKAEHELAKREKRVSKLEIRPLDPGERETFVGRWKDVQAMFVDDPARAVGSADSLLADVMRARGYPVRDFDQRAGDISVDHPRVVEHYRAGHDIAVRHDRGEAGTEELRQAMIHYRELFEELVDETAPARMETEEAH